MKVYLKPDTESRGINRVYKALIQYMPDNLKVINSIREADLVVFHVIGRVEALTRQITSVKNSNKDYAIIQYCLKSTQKPHTKEWVDLWRGGVRNPA